jgi:CHU_C Type IX secretion signal domain
MPIRLLSLAFCLSYRLFVGAQPLLNWDQTWGGGSYEELNGMYCDTDGIYVAGSTRSNADFGAAADTSWNIVLAKLDFEGQVLWHRLYAGDRNDRLWALIPTTDGGLLLGGYSFSNAGGPKSEPNKGGMDVWLIKTDSLGNQQWDRTLGGTGREELFSLLELPDQSGYVLGCHSTTDANGDKSEPTRGGQDFWLVCVNTDGQLRWEKTLGGDAEDQIHDLAWAPNGNLLASGGTSSKRNTGEVGADFARGQKDYWILEYSIEGHTVNWNHRFGGSEDEMAYALCVTRNGRVYLGGRSASVGAPATIYNNGKAAPWYGGDSDYWLLELDENGQKLNEWSYGGSGLDDLYTMEEDEFGHLVIGGVTDSPLSGNKTTPLRGFYDYWVLGVSPEGEALWQATLGGTDIDAMTKMTRKPNGAMIFGGHSQSNSGFEKTNNSLGVNDFWIVTTECNVQVEIQAPLVPSCPQNPIPVQLSIENCSDCRFRWQDESAGDEFEIMAGDSLLLVVQAYDEYGCKNTDSLTVVVPPLPHLTPELPATITLNANDTLQIGYTAPLSVRYQWSTGASTDSIALTAAGLFTLTITDPVSGCTASDQTRVIVKSNQTIWAPNAFNPSLFDENAFFSIYSSDKGAVVRNLQIGSRWGEIIYSQNNLPVNTPFSGWNGRFRGQLLPPDVFVWVAEVQFSNGKSEIYSGNVTIIR